MSKQAEVQKLKKTVQALKEKNSELNSTLKMIQSGRVDSLVVASPMGDKIFTLHTPEQPYRELVESMNEGVATLAENGVLLYCNNQFQNLLKVPYEKLIGSDIRAHVHPESRHTLEFVLERSQIAASRAELNLVTGRRVALPVQVSVNKIRLTGVHGFSLVATDLSHAKQNAVLLRQQEWIGKILNHLPVPLLLVEPDMKGFTFMNNQAKSVLQDSSAKDRRNKNSHHSSFSFVNENGQVFKLDELLERVQLYGKNGYETNLVAKGRRIPVLLFVENLPAIQNMPPVKLLVFQDLTHLKQAQQDLSQALRGRDQFMSALSHELRTPLNVILGWVQILRANPNDNEMVKQALNTLERNANLQRDLIEDLLDVSRIVTGNLALEKKPIDLKVIVDEIMPSCELKAREKSIQIKIENSSIPLVVMADQKRTHQLISHLIYNAIKFNYERGQVTINLSLEKESNHAVIQVKDTGKGIDPAFLPHVFEKFQQENMSTNRNYGGLGLGLAICKTIVAQHQGEISVVSAGEGKGSTFTVKLPLTTQMASSVSSTVGHSGLQVDLRGLRVLVVDDSIDNLALFTIWLRSSGAEIKTMESASGVVEAIHDFRPHVLLSDISMPGEDGYSLIAKVRSLPPQYGGHIPAGAITANARTEDRDLSIAAGYHMHIPKPVTAFSLAKAVKSLSEMAHVH